MICKSCGFEIKAEGVAFCPRCGTKVAQQEATVTKEVIEDSISKIWTEWHMVEVLGKGSFGTVYHAVRKSKSLESHAAVKVISIPADKSEINSLHSEGMTENDIKSYYEDIVDDFENEIRVMESLKGMQNVVSVEDYKIVERKREIGWDIYIRMELLTPFSEYITDKKLTEKEVIKIGVDICSALELCNKMNIIHRDIKPENIFVNNFGYFKLGDFGIARKLENMTGGLSQKGTYSYMAPEVVYGTKYDEKVDIYSLGLVLYRLLNNNRMPFVDTQKPVVSASERKEANDRRIMGEPLESPCNASKEMAEIILKACEYNPDDRYTSATEFKKALLQKFVSKSKENIVIPTPKQIVDDGTATVVAIQREIQQKTEESVQYVNSASFKEENGVKSILNVEELEENTYYEEQKRQKKKKIQVIALVIMLVVALLPVLRYLVQYIDLVVLGNGATVIADENDSELDLSEIEEKMNVTDSGDCGDNLTWKYDNSTGLLFISGIGDMYDYKLDDNGSHNLPWQNYLDNIVSVVISDGVTSIGDCAFNDCNNLTKIRFPDTIRIIGDWAFYRTALTEVTILKNVTTIGYGAFYECYDLKNVMIENGTTLIGKYAFYGCSNLASIGLPVSLNVISDEVFYNCPNLKTVYYSGTEEDWNKISIGSYNENLINATIYYNQ